MPARCWSSGVSFSRLKACICCGDAQSRKHAPQCCAGIRSPRHPDVIESLWPLGRQTSLRHCELQLGPVLMIESIKLTEEDIDDLWRLKKADAMVTLEERPYESEGEAVIHSVLRLGLWEDHAMVLWAAGVRERAAFRAAAAFANGGKISNGHKRRDVGQAVKFLLEHAVGNLHVLGASQGPGRKGGGNGVALLSSLDEVLDAGFEPTYSGISVHRSFDETAREQVYTFSGVPHRQVPYTRTKLLDGPMKNVLRQLKRLLTHARAVYFPIDWQRAVLPLNDSDEP
jgi:hypothetical protein